MRATRLVLFLLSATMFATPDFAAGQTTSGSCYTPGKSAPLPVTLTVRDVRTPPTPPREPRPFVPGQKPLYSSKRKRVKKRVVKKPRVAKATPATPVKAVASPPPAPTAPAANAKADDAPPPLVETPKERISPIVPYVDDEPQTKDNGTKSAGPDETLNIPDTSPELAPAAAPAPKAAGGGDDAKGNSGEPQQQEETKES